ncbi:flagellar hook-associated protein FlgK [Alkalicoccus daliensis]|uniref:Flagellar hook-associated protein 1 n=1 Tax=Alkalicoccus daliensis TaxID=745820 RepID=A0A1H0J238_9BACI|nr:flagellar hook-associated protein FlgK [Alkalicoccus daliensis]SDO37431.1 flagellar hook-associated protein 1 FlgK [Alkalicoccus daliensis]
MLSTFSGLETAKRALHTNQQALQTVGHNIANANTKGYSRQRVNFTQTEAFPRPGFNQPGIPGQMGTGVKAGEIQRVRESFLDIQFRQENHKNGYWNSRLDALTKMEDIMNEPTADGIAQTMDRFWQSMQDLSVNPEDAGARSVVRQRGIALAETINTSYASIQAIQKDYQNELGVKQTSMNSILRQIDSLNKQIASVEPHGYLPNDLYDQRDTLVDELSSFMNIRVDRVPSGGMAKDMADGKYTITALDKNGSPLQVNGENVVLVNGSNLTATQVSLNYSASESGELLDPLYSISFTNAAGEQQSVRISEFNSPGSLLGTAEAYGYYNGEAPIEAGGTAAPGDITGIFPDMLRELDILVSSFAKQFNAVHNANHSLTEIKNNETLNIDFFSTGGNTAFGDLAEGEHLVGAARNFGISDSIKASLDNIAAATAENGVAFAGDGSGALALAGVKDAALNFNGNNTNVQSYYQAVIGEMAVDANEAARMERNTASLRGAVEERRHSVSSVSLDEEMAMMIQFQHAYNAAARSLTNMDDLLDRIINRMGRVGL